MIDLSGRLALVTGGARGIGKATAIRLAESGADVIVNYVSSQEAAEEVANTVSKIGRQAATVKADVSEPEDIASMFDFIGERFGKLDILVSNAASGGFRSLMDASPTNFASAMNTNVRATMLLAQAARPLMQNTSPGNTGYNRKIVAMSSHGSHRALPAYGLIGASKAALESLVRHLALEIGPDGINVNTLLAGLVETDSTSRFPGAEQAFEVVRGRRVTGGNELTTNAVADAILFLCSPLSDLVQGQTLVVDGGEALHG
ncbi:MAG TPA: 1-cyclohexenylcarbonyl CoA reductase [Planctomycetaceae bacterium]|nr:1-cyclohexenylcarbonyl CoA reductase [Planctomycetaceae bacterium]